MPLVRHSEIIRNRGGGGEGGGKEGEGEGGKEGGERGGGGGEGERGGRGLHTCPLHLLRVAVAELEHVHTLLLCIVFTSESSFMGNTPLQGEDLHADQQLNQV
jgi:hypothetical protein